MRCTQIVGHLLRVVEVGNRRWKMRLARKKNVLGAAGQVCFVLLGQFGEWETVVTNTGGVAKVRFHSPGSQTNPCNMHPRANNGKDEQGGIINCLRSIGDDYTAPQKPDRKILSALRGNSRDNYLVSSTSNGSLKPMGRVNSQLSSLTSTFSIFP